MSRAVIVAAALTAIIGADPGSARASECPPNVGRDLPSAEPEDVGLGSAALAALSRYLDGTGKDLHGIAIVRRCRVVFERYKTGVTRDPNHAIHSVTKSVLATLVGILMRNGSLGSLDAPLGALASKPAGVDDEHWRNAASITLAQAMHMSSGLHHEYNPYMAPRNPIYGAPDRFAFAVSQELEHPPGSHFNYSDGDAVIVGAAVSAVAKTDLLSLGKRTLFDPLGMVNYEWLSRDETGRYPGGWGLRLRVMDMAKLGQLYLNRGDWNGVPIITPAFIDEVWRERDPPDYGLFWWRSGTVAYAAGGIKGQIIVVMPGAGMVIAATGNLARADEMSFYRGVAQRAVQARTTSSSASQEDREALRSALSKPLDGVAGQEVWPEDEPRAP